MESIYSTLLYRLADSPCDPALLPDMFRMEDQQQHQQAVKEETEAGTLLYLVTSYE